MLFLKYSKVFVVYDITEVKDRNTLLVDFDRIGIYDMQYLCVCIDGLLLAIMINIFHFIKVLRHISG